MVRRPPRTRATLAAAATVFATVLCAMVLTAVVAAPGAGAQDRTDDPSAVVTPAQARLPVSLGRPSAASAGELPSPGPAVPVLLGLTAAMLAGGALVLWQRCRETARRSGTTG